MDIFSELIKFYHLVAFVNLLNNLIIKKKPLLAGVLILKIKI